MRSSKLDGRNKDLLSIINSLLEAQRKRKYWSPPEQDLILAFSSLFQARMCYT